MSTAISLCALVVMAVSVAITVLAFMYIFQNKQASENDLNVIQRQIRGFALLIVSNIIMTLGMVTCSGAMLPSVLNLLR